MENKKERDRKRERERERERKEESVSNSNPLLLTFPHCKAFSMRKCLKPGKW